MDLSELFERKIVLKRNEFLFQKGKLETAIYFIASGSIRIFMLDGDVEQIIRFGYTNDLIVALDSFLTEKPTDYSVQAIKQTEVFVISKNKFIEYLNRDLESKQKWIEILENLVLQQLEREKDILIQSPKERYQRVLKRSPRLFQEIPSKHIANYLRMSPETLSRLKKS